MTLILINLVLVFAIISYELTPVCLGNNILEYTWSRKNVTRKLKGHIMVLFLFLYQIIHTTNIFSFFDKQFFSLNILLRTFDIYS